MSRNPNMLRTLIGLGLVLIIILGYAVHSNTVDSEYYMYETSNSEQNMELIQLEENSSESVSYTHLTLPTKRIV